MLRLKVVIVGTTPAETLHLEEALQQTGCLETFRYMGLVQAQERVPDWNDWDLIVARYQEKTGPILLALLAPVLRSPSPRVILLVDAFDPLFVTRMLNAGASHVLPIQQLEDVLEPSLRAVFSGEWARRSPVTASLAPVQVKNGPGQPDDHFPRVENSFARLFRSSPIGISINRLRDGVCLDCNESFARMLESTREELVGSTPLEFGPLDSLRAQLQRARQTPGGALRFDRKIYTRSRQIRHAQMTLDLIEWDGEPCFISLVQDITENEQAKERIKRLNDELERTVLVRTGALEAANRELAAEISRRKYLEDFSHQLNQVIWETPDVVAIYDSNGRMQFLNKAGRDLFGLGENAPVAHLDMYHAYSEDMRQMVRREISPMSFAMGSGMEK